MSKRFTEEKVARMARGLNMTDEEIEEKPAILATPEEAQEFRIKGLELSEIMYCDLSKLKVHELNAEWFDKDKAASPQYMDGLYRDIRENGIRDPLIVLPDWRILEGHSRRLIAMRLADEGTPLKAIPYRMVLEELPEQKVLELLVLGNLSRFAVSENTRIRGYALIWPGFFNTEPRRGNQAGSIGHGVQLTDDSDHPNGHGVQLGAADIAEKTGLSVRHVNRTRKQHIRAIELAREAGREAIPSAEDYAKAAEEARAERRKKAVVPDRMISVSRLDVAIDRVGSKAQKYAALAASGKYQERNTAKAEAYRDAVQIFRKAAGLDEGIGEGIGNE